MTAKLVCSSRVDDILAHTGPVFVRDFSPEKAYKKHFQDPHEFKKTRTKCIAICFLFYREIVRSFSITFTNEGNKINMLRLRSY